MLRKIVNALRFKRKLKEKGYRCDICGEITILKHVNTKTNIEIYQCPSCGSQVLWKYSDDGVTKSVWDNLHMFQYRVFYRYDYLVDKNGDVAIFWRADKLK